MKMKKVVALVGMLIVIAAMANAINVKKETVRSIDGINIVPLNKVITSSLQGNVQISSGEEEDQQ